MKGLIAFFISSCLLILVPWLLFKWMNGLAFGNAKSVTGLTLSWQQGVFQAIVINTFFEGNWLLLFPLLIILLIWRRQDAFRTPLVLFSGFFLVLYFAQLPLFFLTELSTEALMQTGYARGLIHLMPGVVVLVTLLMARIGLRD